MTDNETDVAWADRVASFQNLMDQVHNQVHSLRAYDGREEIDAHCDDLMSQIMLSVESTIKRINKQGNELLQRVESYRKSLKDRFSLVSATETGKQVEKLLEKFDAFYHESLEHVFEKEDPKSLEISIQRAHEYSIRLGKAKQLIKAKTFQENQLVFKEHPITSDTYEYGSLDFREDINFQQGE